MAFHAAIRPPKRGIYTIGYLDDNDCNEFFTQILEGLSDAARRQGVNLVRFGYFTGAGEPAERHEALLSLIRQADLDGLVFLGWTQAGPMYNLAGFPAQLPDLPVLSAGTAFEDIPSVFCEGAEHIRHMIRHLIRRHGFRRIAFLPPERPDNRDEAWEQVLREYGLWYPELRIREEEWGVSGSDARARRFLEILLDERGVPLDAVVSSGQYETEALMKELERRHLRIPEDIALTGYVDGDFERYAQPGITTVDYPWSEIGYHAMMQMLALLKTGVIPMVTVVPGRVLYRGSCGCVTDVVHLSAVGPVVPSARSLAAMMPEERILLVETLQDEFASPDIDFDRLLDTLAADCHSEEPRAFLPELARQVAVTAVNLRHARLETLVARFRSAVLPWLAADPDMLRASGDLFRQAQTILSNAVMRSRGHAQIQAKNQAQAMQETSQAVMTEHSIPAILAALMENLQKLDVSFCCVILPDGVGTEPAGSPVSMDAFLERGEASFLDVRKKEIVSIRNLQAGDLFQRLLPDSGSGRFLQVHPLLSEGRWMGYVLFEPGPVDEMLYRTLAAHLSSAFISATMVERLEMNYRRLVERAYDEGMADVVSQVMHNIGNMYNSVNASVQILTGELAQSPVPDLLQAETLLRSLPDNAALEAGQEVERRRKLMTLFGLLGRRAEKHRETLMTHFGRISRNVRWMDESITIQQGYASGGGPAEPAPLLHLMEDALRVYGNTFERAGITVIKGWHAAPMITVHRGRLYQVLVYLLGALGGTAGKAGMPDARIWLSVDLRAGDCILRMWAYGPDLREFLVRREADLAGNGSFFPSGDPMPALDACFSNVREMGGELVIGLEQEEGKSFCELRFPVSDTDAGGVT